MDQDDFPESDLAPELGGPEDLGPADDEPFADESNEGVRVRLSVTEIEIWDSGSELEWYVRPPSMEVLDDEALAPLALLREQRLERYARGVADDFLSVSTLKSSAFAVSALTIWNSIRVHTITIPKSDGGTAEQRWNSQAAIAARWGVDASALSKDQGLLIGLPNGEIVPLQFFFWKTTGDRLVEKLVVCPVLTTASIEEVVRITFSDKTDRRTAKDLVPWARAAVLHPETLATAREGFIRSPSRYTEVLESLRADLIRSDGRIPRATHHRGLNVLHRGMVGGIR